MRQRLFKGDHPNIATSLNNLAGLYNVQGCYSEAEPLYQKALAMRQRLKGDDSNVANALNNLALLYQAQERYSEAEPLYRDALAIRQRLFKGDHPDVAESLNSLATLYKAQERYSKAERLSKQALAMRQRLSKGDDPDVANSLNNLAAIYEAQGRYSEAEPLQQKALAIRKRLFGGNHSDVANSLNNLAALYYAQGRYSEAEPFYQKALAIRKRLFNDDHPDVAQSLSGLATLYDAQGRYLDAESLLQKALAMRQRLFKGDHSDIARSLNNLAALYDAQGRYLDAEALYQEALAMGQRLFKGDHSDVANTLNNLALLYETQGRYLEAEQRHQEALAMRQSLFKGDHLDMARSLNKALGVKQSLFKGDHPSVALSLNNLACLYDAQGRYSDAEPYYQQALAMRQRLFKGDHPDVAQSLSNLAVFFAATDRHAEALELMQKAIKIENRIARRELTASSESNRLRHLEKIGASFEAFLSLILLYFSEDKAAVRAALDAVLARKSLAAAAQAAQNQALYSSRYPHLQKEFRQLRQLSDEIIKLTYAQPDPERLASKQEEFDRLEAQLASQVPEIQLQLGEIDRRAMALELPEGSTLVEFVRFRLLDFSAKQWQPARYIAFILPAGESNALRLVDLGDAAPIDILIRAFRTAASRENEKNDNFEGTLTMWGGEDTQPTPELSIPSYNANARFELGKKLFHPLRETLTGAQHLFLAPDGDLNLVPFRVLLADEAGEKLLMQDYTTSYHNVGRDILRFKLEAERLPGSPLIIADPYFDLGADKTDKNKTDKTDRSYGMASELLGDLAGVGFRHAPGTRYLGERVAEMLGVEARLGADALESHLKANLAPEILLIATHGYFGSTRQQWEKYANLIFKLLESPAGEGYHILQQHQNLLDEKLMAIMKALAARRDKSGDSEIAGWLRDLAARLSQEKLIATHGYFGSTRQQRKNYADLIIKLLESPTGEEYHILQQHQNLLDKQLMAMMKALAARRDKSGDSEIAGWLRDLAARLSHETKKPEIKTPGDLLAHPKVENPMLRSGLALAGANTWLKGGKLPEKAGKGFLFAQEVAQLDLRGNEIAVLSACNTAMGDVKAGEGVFGLRRAFAIAGTKTLVMSLWPVPDKATALLMERFFNNLQAGFRKAPALQEAQDYIRGITVKELRESELGRNVLDGLLNVRLNNIDSEQWAELEEQKPLQHPFYWGAWICQGEF